MNSLLSIEVGIENWSKLRLKLGDRNRSELLMLSNGFVLLTFRSRSGFYQA